MRIECKEVFGVVGASVAAMTIDETMSMASDSELHATITKNGHDEP